MKVRGWRILLLLIVTISILKCNKKQVDMAYLPLMYITIDEITSTTVVLIGSNAHTGGQGLGTSDFGFYYNTANHTESDKDIYIGMASGSSYKFEKTLTGLTPGTEYYAGSYAVNSYGRGGSAKVNFKTLSSKPVIVTSFVLEFTNTSAVLGGQVVSEGGGPVTDCGVYWGLSPMPENSGIKLQIGKGIGEYSSEVKGLSPGTTYYVRAYATNSSGTAVGLQYSFNTGQNTEKPIIIDVDSNVYHYVTVGNQVWMAENLKVTKLNDSAIIPLVLNGSEWQQLTTPGYCYYNNEVENKAIYGALYNWNAVNSGKLCPVGWHVPSLSEWTSLINYLGGEEIAGTKLMEVGIAHWISRVEPGYDSNKNATNESGFTALPGGGIINDDFSDMHEQAIWWCSTNNLFEEKADVAFIYYNWYKVYLVNNRNGINDGLSVRCLKD